MLKPVNDPRNYKKIGISLAETKKYEVNIIGFSTKNIPAYPNIRFHPIFRFPRISFQRLASSWKIYKKLLEVKPDLIICNTHELLIVIALYKILFGTKILYDIQENYFKNIVATNAFPPVIRTILARYVRLKETLLAPFIDHFFLAEKCYQTELGFLRSRYTIVENKFASEEHLPSVPLPRSDKMILVYTGTIAEEYGVFDAIHFATRLNEYLPVRFHIIGHCPNSRTLVQLKKTTGELDFVVLTGGNEPVPHQQILTELKAADFALLPYRLDTYYSNRIPTKIYECLALRTPMIIRENPAWDFLYKEFDAFIFSDFRRIEPNLLEQIRHGTFFTRGNTTDILWSSEKTKVQASVASLIYK